MRWLAVVGLVGCSFSPGAYRGDGGSIDEDVLDPTEDVITPDMTAPPVTCYAKWFDGTIRFGTPVPIAELNTTSYERDPFLTDDELTVYVSSGRSSDNTIWRATRTSPSGTFGAPVKDASFGSTDGAESKLSLTSDQLIAVVGSSRGNSQALDVWGAQRASATDAWPAFVQVPGVNTNSNDHDPTISANGLRLYLAPDDSPPQRVHVATRASRLDAFGAPALIAELGDTGSADPSPTPDERILLFASGRTGAGVGGGNVWYSTRATTNDPFATPLPVPDINTNENEGDPHLSTDGCRIYFAREINLGSYDWDIHVATAVP